MASKKGPSCSCLYHEEFSGGINNGRIIKLASKKVKVSTIKYMKDQGLIPLHASAICEACKCHAEKNMESEQSAKRLKLDNVSIFIDNIENGSINDNDIILIVQAIGKRISPNILRQCNTNSDDYGNVTSFHNFRVKGWLQKQNAILLNFIMYSANVTNLDNEKKTLCVASAVDSVYKARVLNAVSPLPFYTNLVSYFICGSSRIARLNATHSPAGSYTCLKNWLRANSIKEACRPPTNKDTVSFFDNNQVVARNWRVNYNYKTCASVITNIIHIQPSMSTNIQGNQHYCPSKWLYQNTDHIDKINVILEESSKTFDTIRDQYLAHRLQTITVKDAVDIHLNDGIQPSLNRSESDPYMWIESHHPQLPPHLSVGEPCMVNPCSFQAVTKVFSHIQQQCEIGQGKYWTAIGCDGLPYSLAQKLLSKPENECFRNLLIMPGNGHIELNATRALFKILWDVSLEDVAKLHGFRSPRALLAAKNCADHHKSWQLLSVFFFGTLDEVLRNFIVYSKGCSADVSIDNFYKYINDSKNPNQRFMCDILTNYVLALFVFRTGIRRGNYEVMTAGKFKLMKLFFGLNMTTYQMISYYDLKLRALAPVEVLEFIKTIESFSISGHASKGEGGDFVLESVNGKTKRWLPPGAPTQKHWLEVCRNIDTLEKIRDTVNKQLGIEQKQPKMYQRDLSLEIFQWRKYLRNDKYLQNNNETNKIHTSISGASVLDTDLLVFERTCTNNLQSYLNNIKDGNDPGKGAPLNPVFVTEEDREKFHDIRNKTKAKISEMISEIIKEIEELGRSEESLILERQWGKIKVGTKDALLQFYKEVVVALQDATNGTVSDDESSEESDMSDDE